MSGHDHAAKVIEVIGTSDESIEKAINVAIARTAETINKLRWFEVTEMRGQIEGDRVERYQVMLKIGFAIEE